MMDGHSSYIIEHGIYFKNECDYILYLNMSWNILESKQNR